MNAPGHLRLLIVSILLITISPRLAGAQAQATRGVRGTVIDPVGHPVAGARVFVLGESGPAGETSTGADGSYSIPLPRAGAYSVHVEAPGLRENGVAAVHVGDGGVAEAVLHLEVGGIPEQVVVTATGTETPASRTGASVSLIDGELIRALNKLDVLEELRLVPGAQVVQTGQRGGTTALYLRGGESDFNKVVIDGIPANMIGGNFDFAQLTSSGVAGVEVLRGANSVLYGSDALAGVVSITSARGSTPAPELRYAADGGNFGTLHQDASIGQAAGRIDYFGNFARYDTRGSYPNDLFHNVTFDGDLGWSPRKRTGVRVVGRHNTTDLGVPNAISLFGIEDDSTQRNGNTYLGGTVEDQTSRRWHNQARFAYAQFSQLYENPSPTGTSYDSPLLGTVYLGRTVTIRGANGYRATGQAILDYAGEYPELFPSYEGHRSVNLQTEYLLPGEWTGVLGARFEHENGQGLTRNNYDYYAEAHGSVGHRLFAAAGVGVDKNEVFGLAASPRLSIAWYLGSPLDPGLLGQTRLRLNLGQGIEEPSTSEQASALVALLTPEQVAEFGISPIGPQRSRTWDAGVEQGIAHGRALVGATFFYNRFYDLISFLGVNDLIALGVAPAAAQATAVGGAYVNADSQRALGAELDARIDLGRGMMLEGSYTYIDAVTTKAFGAPSFNPLFPDIPIGAFSPLVGARPFRIAPHSGSLALSGHRKGFTGSFSGALVDRRDDSTFLSDANGGDTLLLPNRNLAPAYGKFDMSLAYAVRPSLEIYSSIENLLSQHYEATFGYPAAPFTIRSGLRFTLGGPEGWGPRR